MVQQQETSGSVSDVPKRTSGFLPFRARGTTYGAIVLLLVNISVAHTFGTQLVPRAPVDMSFVKDEEVSAVNEVELSSEQSAEDLFASQDESDSPAITTYIVQKVILSQVSQKSSVFRSTPSAGPMTLPKRLLRSVLETNSSFCQSVVLNTP